jgi:hypothetical protein
VPRTKFQIRSDAAKQRWVRDDRKEAFWRKHLTAWKRSGQSKRAYCISNTLSQSSFNAWSREIAIRDREKTSSLNATELLEEERTAPNDLFVPLRLLNSDLDPEPIESNSEPRDQWLADSRQEASSIEIAVPGGITIKTDSGCAPEYLAKLLHTLKG